MLQVCREFQLRWIERDASEAAVDDEVSTHSLDCPDCKDFVRRAVRLTGALLELDRQDVPDELPGRVVAACNAGYLQDRAAALLGSVARVEAPKALDRTMLPGEAPRLHAPQVLDRLVDEDLRDPTLSAARRFTQHLKRLEAPTELVERVQRELEGPIPATVVRRERLQAIRWSLVGLVVVVGLVLGLTFGVRETNAAPALTFEVQRVQSVNELDGLARAIAGGLSGGWSEITWGEAR